MEFHSCLAQFYLFALNLLISIRGHLPTLSDSTTVIAAGVHAHTYMALMGVVHVFVTLMLCIWQMHELY